MAWRDRADDRVVHAQRACRLAPSLPGLFGRQAGTKMPVGRAQLVVVGGGAEPPVRTEEPAPTVAPSSSGRIVTSLPMARPVDRRSEEHTSELQSRGHLVCRLLLEKKKIDMMAIVYKR